MKSTKDLIEVTTTTFTLAKWICPACGKIHDKGNVSTRQGRQTLRCFVCKQELQKDEAGTWKTSNTIVKDRGVYKEALEADCTPVTVEEQTFVERFEYRCPLCNSANRVDMGREINMPFGYRQYFSFGELLDQERNAIKMEILKCPACATLLGKEDEDWIIYKEGNPQKAFKPRQKQAVEIRPEIRAYLSWSCPCGHLNRQELGNELESKKEPKTSLTCGNCKNTATKIKDKFVMLYPK